MTRDVDIELGNPTMESGSEADYYFQNSSFDEGESDLDVPSFFETSIDCTDPMLILMIRQGDMEAALDHIREMRSGTDQIITQRVIEQQWRHDDDVKEVKSTASKFANTQARIRALKAAQTQRSIK